MEIENDSQLETGNLIEPKAKPTFMVDGKYYCNICQEYSDDFQKSAIQRQFRRCRPCYAEFRAPESSEPIECLRRGLMKRFRNNEMPDIARGVTRESIAAILAHHQTTAEFVRYIIPPLHQVDVSMVSRYIVEYK